MMTKQRPPKKVANKVREWCDERGLDKMDFVEKCIRAGVNIEGKRLTYDTISRVYDGDTNISMMTATLISLAAGVTSISELFDIE